MFNVLQKRLNKMNYFLKWNKKKVNFPNIHKDYRTYSF